jgi:hypothetical protein
VQERLSKLEKNSNEHEQKIGSLENGFDSLKPLMQKMDKLTEAMIHNTASHKIVSQMQDRMTKRLDSLELDSRSTHDELAAARPAVKLMNELSKKMMYFGLFMFTMTVAVAAYVIKT